MEFLLAESTSMTLLRTRYLFGTAVLTALVLGLLTLRWLLAQLSVGAGRQPGAAARRWWREEVWLGGPFAAGRRQALAQGWFTVTFAAFMLRWVLGHTLIPDKDFLCRVLCDLVFWLIAVKLLLLTRYSLRQLLTAGLLVLPFLLSCAKSGSQFVLYQILFLLTVKDIDLRKAFRIVYGVLAAAVLLVMLLAAAGAVPTIAWDIGRARNSFGFGHPNTCGKYLLYLMLGWFLLRYDRLRWYSWWFPCAVLLFCRRCVDSRTAELCMLALILAGLLARYCPRFWQAGWVRALGTAAPLAAAAASFALAFGYRADSPFWQKLELLSSGRMGLFSLAVHRGRLTLLGQDLISEELYTLDNLYLSAFYLSGLLVFVAYLGLLCLALYRCWQQGWTAETVVLLCLAVYGCLEGVCWMDASPAPLLFANALYAAGQPWRLRISRAGPPRAAGPAEK